MVLSGCIITESDDMIIGMIGMGDVAAGLVLAGFCALAWCRRRAVGGKTWAFRVVPFGLFVCFLFARDRTMELVTLGLTLVAYAVAAYRGGWRLAEPKNRLLRHAWWLTHVVVYYVMAVVLCGLMAGVVGTVVRWSPLATEADWPWRGGEISDEMPFAVEYKRAKTFCAEYDKRLVFKSGKRIGLLIDTCGYGPFRVYKMKDGLYCLEDGYGWCGPDPDAHCRFLRVNVEKEMVELKHGIGWFPIPGKGYVRGWGGVSNDLKRFSFDMYSGGDLNGEGWWVTVEGTPVGKSLDGMRLIGEIDTCGRFRSLR